MPEVRDHTLHEMHYEFDGATDNAALDELMKVRQGIVKEVIESFGEEMGDVMLSRKYTTTFDTTFYPDIELPEKTGDDIIIGLLRFAHAAGFDNGAGGRWARAVMEIAEWFSENIHVYSQSDTEFCPLTNRLARCDCSGFVTSCLWRYGALQTVSWPPSSSAYTSAAYIADLMEAAGFVMLPFSWEEAKPFDIIAYSGHIEIYNGILNGRKSSWSWGSCHDKAHGGLPCSTAAQSRGYEIIWRNTYTHPA